MSTVQTPLCSNRTSAAKIVLIHVKFGNEPKEQESDFSVAKVSHLGDSLEMNYNFLNISSLKAQNYLKKNNNKKSKSINPTKKKPTSPLTLNNNMENVTFSLQMCAHNWFVVIFLLLNLPLPVFLFGHEIQILV